IVAAIEKLMHDLQILQDAALRTPDHGGRLLPPVVMAFTADTIAGQIERCAPFPFRPEHSLHPAALAPRPTVEGEGGVVLRIPWPRGRCRGGIPGAVEPQDILLGVACPDA